MEDALLKFLIALEKIGEEHEELYDTDVREQMYDAVINSFINPKEGYILPVEFGMFSSEGNSAVRSVLERILPEFLSASSNEGLDTPLKRLLSFQNENVETPGEGNFYDDFFGYIDPDEIKW
jgi:hypothetical protein